MEKRGLLGNSMNMVDLVRAVAEVVKTTENKRDDKFDLQMLVDAMRAKDNKNGEIQSHGLTQGEVKEIHRMQRNSSVKMIKANRAERMNIPAHEAHLVHFSTELVSYDPATGAKLSKPRMHCLYPSEFERMGNSVKKAGDKVNPENAFSGKKVVIYHDPRAEKKGGPKKEEKTQEELLMEMDETKTREYFEEVIGQPSLPSDTVHVMRELIKERWNADKEAI